MVLVFYSNDVSTFSPGLAAYHNRKNLLLYSKHLVTRLTAANFHNYSAGAGFGEHIWY
jgi:hypothetical protein